MENQHVSIMFNAKIQGLESVNEEFDLCKVYVQGIGKNRNYSYMSKDNVQNALSTLPYVPVIGHLIEDYDEDGNVVGRHFGGHDMELTDDWQLKSLCVPFGVVIDDSFEFEMVEEFGARVEYLTAKVYLWTGRYPELKEAIYNEDTWFNQSMEISVKQSRPLESDSNFTEILDWTYSALCILGKSDDPSKHTEPCFISSRFVPFSVEGSNELFNSAMEELKTALAGCCNSKSSEEGGMSMSQENIQAIFEEFEVSQDEVGFDFSEMNEETLRAALAEYKASKSGETFSIRYGEMCDILRCALPACTDREEFWLIDFDDTYVYARHYVYGDDCDSQLVRFGYTFDKSAKTATVSETYEEMFIEWLTAEEVTALEARRTRLEELEAFKAEYDRVERTNLISDITEEFSDLSEVEEYTELCAIVVADVEYDLEQFKEKCYSIRGRNMKPQKQSFSEKTNKNTIRIDVNKTKNSDSFYGGLLQKEETL